MRKALLFIPSLALATQLPLFVMRSILRTIYVTGTESEAYVWSLKNFAGFLADRRFITANDLPQLWLAGNIILLVAYALIISAIAHRVIKWIFKKYIPNYNKSQK